MPLYLPELYEENTSRSMTDSFLGLNRKLRIADGEWFDMKNLTSDEVPVLSVRKRRGIPDITAVKPYCITTRSMSIAGSFIPLFLDGSVLVFGSLYRIDLSPYGYQSDGADKQIIHMGAYIIIVPDMIYVNTAIEKVVDGVHTLECGRIEDRYESTVAKWVITVSDYEGRPADYTQAEKPVGTEKRPLKNGDLWHKTGSEPSLRRYDAEADEWYEISSYLRMQGFIPGIDEFEWLNDEVHMKSAVRAGDTMQFSGLGEAVDGVRQIYKATEAYGNQNAVRTIYVQGIINTEKIEVQASADSPIVIERVIPNMDYVCEAGNRLWGCRYGYDKQGNFVNEIYCSARGDFYRWILGDADNEDSPVTFSIGSDGVFTGAVNYDGYPTFFKERMMHRVSGSGASGFSIYDLPCEGVAKGDDKSIAVIRNILYYKSACAIMAFDGSIPIAVSEKLGNLYGYTGAVGCAYRDKYYVSMSKKAADGTVYEQNLFVLDTKNGLWFCEDDTLCESMANAGDNMYFIAVKKDGERTIHTIMTVKPLRDGVTQGIEDEKIPWYAETGIIGLETPDSKYMTKIAIRMHMDAGATVRVSVQYDSVGTWKQIMATESDRMKTITMPIMPARCDHMRLRLDGVGGCKIYSITKTFESAEDL